VSAAAPAAFEDGLALELQAARVHAAGVEARNCELLKLCVALSHLSAAVTTADVTAALREIVINVVGSERFAIFETAPDGRVAPLTGMGLETHELMGLARQLGAATPAAGLPLVARVPLRLGATTVGELAIVELLEHKGGLDAFDHELLDVLSTAAGSALSGARLRDRAATAA
jgi:hypothetical protein